MSGGETPNLVLKTILELFLKVPPLNEILEFQKQKKKQKKTMKFVQKENWESKIKSINEKTYKINFINKKTNKQKVLNITQELEGEKGSKNFFRVLEFLSKIPNIKKKSNKHFVWRKYL